MVTAPEVTSFYTIIEKWEEPNSLGNFFIEKGIHFSKRTSQNVQQDTGFWRTTVVYDVHLLDEDTLYIKLVYPHLRLIKRNYS